MLPWIVRKFLIFDFKTVLKLQHGSGGFKKVCNVLMLLSSGSQQVGRDPFLGRVHLLLGRQNLCFSTILVYMGRQKVYHCTLWVANYQTLRTTGLDPKNCFFFKSLDPQEILRPSKCKIRLYCGLVCVWSFKHIFSIYQSMATLFWNLATLKRVATPNLRTTCLDHWFSTSGSWRPTYQGNWKFGDPYGAKDQCLATQKEV